MKILLYNQIKKFLIKISDLVLLITSNEHLKIKIDKSKPHNKEEAFSQILELLNSNEFDYFISGGTLLGIYRDGQLIESDDDIDIDIFNNSYRKKNKKIIDFAKANGYQYRIGPNYFHPKISLCIANTKVSLGAISRGLFKRNYFYRAKYRIPYLICKESKKFKTNNNLVVKIPYKTADYLQFVYGESWSKPVKWEEDDQDKYYNYEYIRKGKRYVLIDYSQRLLSKFIYLFKDFYSYKILKNKIQ